MSDIIDVNISEEPVPEVVEVHVDENAAQTAIDAAALAQNALTQVQNLVANIADVNTILNDEGFVKDATTFTGNENSVWNINGVEYTNPADVIINIPLAATGMQRWDRIVLNTSNLFERVPGPELETNPPVPSLPDDTLDYTLFLVTDSTVGDPSPPIVGDVYKKKIENSRWKSMQSGSEVVIPFQAAGQSHYIVVNSGLVSVAGFSNALLTTPMYEGQDVIFENQTGNSIGLKNMFVGVSTPLNLGADLVVPNEGKIWFKCINDKLELMMKSWSDIVEISNEPFNALKLDSNGDLFKEEEFTTAYKHTGVCEAMGYSFNTLSISQLRTAPVLSAGATFSSLATLNSNYFSMMRKYGVVSDGTAGAMMGLNGGTEYAVFIALGFYYSISFGVADAADVADARMSVGVISSPTVANVNPSTLTDCIMLGNDSGEANLQIMHNDSSGVCTKIDLGVNFPSNTRNTDWYQFEIYCKGNESIVYYRVTRKNTGHVTTGIINTNLPSQTQGIGFHFKRGSGTTALPVRLAFGQFIRSYS